MAYALVALGFVLVLNASGAVNFAHGDLVVLGGAAAVFASLWTGLPGPLLLPLVALALGAAGIVAARLAILPLAARPPEGTFVAKGGLLADTAGRQCLCNSLLATIGLAQTRVGGGLEPPLLTGGDDLARLGSFLAGRTRYSAADVVSYLLGTDTA